MVKLIDVSAAIAALALVGATPAQAQGVFDMKGGWSGTTNAIVRGLAAHHPAGEPSRPAGVARLREVTFTYKIEGQDGPRFWGTVSSPNHVEQVIGAIASDGKRLYIATEDGFVDGVIVDNDRHVLPAAPAGRRRRGLQRGQAREVTELASAVRRSRYQA
jgi:hypothetical protein